MSEHWYPAILLHREMVTLHNLSIACQSWLATGSVLFQVVQESYIEHVKSLHIDAYEQVDAFRHVVREIKQHIVAWWLDYSEIKCLF